MRLTLIFLLVATLALSSAEYAGSAKVRGIISKDNLIKIRLNWYWSGYPALIANPWANIRCTCCNGRLNGVMDRSYRVTATAVDQSGLNQDTIKSTGQWEKDKLKPL